MHKLFKVTAAVSIVTITTCIAGLVRAKFTAITLGPGGVGIFSQAFNFQQLAITIASLNIGLGIAKYVAQYKAENDLSKVKDTILAAFAMQGMATLGMIVLMIAFLSPLSKFLFSSYEYRALLLFLSISVMSFVAVSTMEAALFGFGNYQAFAKCRSYANLLQLIPLFIFIYTMKVRGGFLYLAVSGVISFIVYYCIFRKNVPEDIVKKIFSLKEILNISDSVKKIARDMLLYAGVISITSIIGLISIVFLRSMLIRYFGPDANGYYQVVFSLSAYHIALFTNGLWSYSYAKLSTMTDPTAYAVEVNHTMRFCILGIMPIIVILFLLRDVMINMVFSNKFIYARELFPTQLFGDLFFMLFYVMSLSLLASSRLRAYLAFGLFSSAFMITAFLLLREVLGMRAITVSYLAANAVSLFAIILYHIKKMQFTLYARNLKLFISALCLCGVVLFTGGDNLPMAAVKVILLCGWLGILTTASEKKKAWDAVISRTRILRGSA